VTHTNFTFLAGLVGCKGLSPKKELSCVRKVPAQTLENALSYYSGNDTIPSISFKPVIDNKTAFSNWTERVLDGKIAKTVSTQILINWIHENINTIQYSSQ
jgi:hypothetical protein